jgi:hypothetical protein
MANSNKFKIIKNVVFENGVNKKCTPKMHKKVDAKRGLHSRWKIDLH